MDNNTALRAAQVDTSDIPPMRACNLDPMEFNIVVAPVPPRIKVGSILIPDSVADKNGRASMRGRILKVSPLAFTYAEDAKWGEADKPKPGDAILFSRHAGVVLDADDPASERVIKDVDVIAVIR